MTWEEVGLRVATIRHDRDLTRAQFGKIIGVSGQYVGRIERGSHRLSVNLIASICKATGVSSDYILFGIVNPLDTASVINELSPEQIEIGLDILKRLAQLINTENGNEALIQEIMRRQCSGKSEILRL